MSRKFNKNMKYLNPEELAKYVDEHTGDSEMHYVLIDEIQKVDNKER